MNRIAMMLIGVVLMTSFHIPGYAQMRSESSGDYAKNDLFELTIVQGDCLANICKTYLDRENRWPEIARINRLRNPDMIQPGEKIMVPVVYLKGTPLESTATFVQGDAQVQQSGQGEWAPLKTGDIISPKSILKTGAESALEISFEDGSSFFLRSDTQMAIERAQKILPLQWIRDLFISVGRVFTSVQESTGEAPRFKVRTPSAVVSVRGTEFRVAVDENQQTYAEAIKNLVAVDGADQSVHLAQGEGTVVKKGEPPLPPIKLLPPPAPADLKTIFNVAPEIRFSEVQGAASYRVMVSSDLEGRHLLREKIIPCRESVVISGLEDGTYYLLAQSIDPIGLEGLPSKAYPLRIRLNPLPPMIQAPKEGAKSKGAAPAFQWLSVSDADHYHVQYGEDPEFTAIVQERANLKETTFRPEGLSTRSYFFRISSIAEDGYQGAWSDPLAFTVLPLPPTPSVDQPEVSKDEIHLQSRRLGEGFAYHFQVARDEQFKELLVDAKTEHPEITIKTPKDAGIYHVRIAAVDQDGDAGAFSPPQRFEIKKRFPYEWVGGGGLALFILLVIAP